MKHLSLVLVLFGLYIGIHGVYAEIEVTDTVMVTTPVGNITGFTSTIGVFQQNYQVLNFLGIPYAETTTGQSRFSKPVPKENFWQTFDATQPGPACIQLSALEPAVKGVTYAEDCLVLNVYTPGDATPGAKYPVMIFIHGGGFITGMSNLYKDGYMSGYGDVILVTINYRLAELGFLTTGDKNARGNMGLWDQHLAIKWVRNNIRAFGGDTQRVTLFGESAGSASVIYQMLFPGNKGLFQRAIAESGSITSPWAYTKIDRAVNSTNSFAKLLDCSFISPPSLVSCLLFKTESDFNKVMNTVAIANGNIRWTPVVDNEFVFDDPDTILSGKSTSQKAPKALETFNSIDLIMGVNSKEGYLEWDVIAKMINNTADPKALKTIPKTAFEKLLIPYYTELYFKKSVPQDAINAAIFEYTDWSDVNNDYKRTNSMIDMVSHVIFYVPTIQTVNARVKNGSTMTSSTYVYHLSNKPPVHFLYVPPTMDGRNVTNHADDLAYILVDMGLNTTYNPVFNVYPKVAKVMMSAWTNFAKTGNPNTPIDLEIANTTWPEYGMEEHFMEITAEMTSESVKQRLAPEAYQFWQYFVPTLIRG